MNISTRIRRSLLILIAVLGILPADAITKFDDLYYEFDYTHNTARVVRTALMATDQRERIIIPPTVKYLTTVYTVTEVSASAFYGLYCLKAVEFPSTLTFIGQNAFQGCSAIKNITLPASLVTIESGAFSGCNFTSVQCEAPVPPYAGGSVSPFSEETLRYATLSVPRGSVDAYKAAASWSRFARFRYIGQVDPVSITIDPAVTLNVGESRTLVAILAPADVTETDVTWTSSNTGIVSVNNGVLTARETGTATITAKTTNNITAVCQVKVVRPVTELSVNAMSDMHVGETAALRVTITPSNATEKTLTYQSSNSGCVSVDAAGNVRAVALGSATITVRAQSGVSATVSVNVIPTPVASLSIPGSLSLMVGESSALTAVIYPSDATYQNLTWKSSNPSVAGVDSRGNVSAFSVASATVTATAHNGVSASAEVTVLPVEATSISLSRSELDLALGQFHTLVADIQPENATDKSVVWTSSDPSVATVSASGRVTAVAVGRAVVTVQTVGGLSAVCVVNVAIPVNKVVLDLAAMGLADNNAQLKATERLQILATVEPADATEQSLTYSSSDPAKVAVTPDGLLTANAVGRAIISVKASSGASALLNVSVVPTFADNVALDVDNLSLRVGDTSQLTAFVAPSTTTDKSLTWTSSNPAVAVVNPSGLVTAVGLGSAVVTVATINGLEAKCDVKVVPTLAQSVAIVPESVELTLGGEGVLLTAEVLPVNATDKSVAWSISDESVATVSESGMLVSLAEGNAVVTAVTLDGSDLVATCHVTVVPALVQSIAIVPESVELIAGGDGILLSAEVLPETATDKSVAWSISDESVATVSESGMLLPLAEGDAVVTAATLDGSGLMATCNVTVLPDEAGIVNIVADAAEGSLFTLTGIRIPAGTRVTPGIYIRRANGVTTRVIVR